MNDILTRQNIPNLIELLKAHKIVHQQCKNFQIFDVICFVIALLFPLLIIKYPNFKHTIYAFGALWTIIYLLAEVFRINKAKQSAIILEQFDTELYTLQWNKVLCNDKLSIRKIIELSTKYSKNSCPKWYSKKIDTSLPKEILTLLCQRVNISYATFQKQKYIILLSIVTALYYVIYIVIAFKHHARFFNFLAMLSSSISFLVYYMLNFISLKSYIKSKNKTLAMIDKELENFTQTKSSLPLTETIRQIQDVIFIERTVPEKIPDWFYRLNHFKNERYIDNLIIKIENNLKQKSNSIITKKTKHTKTIELAVMELENNMG